jgi:hypothetical protein
VPGALLAAVVLAVAIGVAATIVGALVHTETRHAEGPDQYHLYGWPWDWRTDASTELIRVQRSNSDNYRYNDSGFALNVFLFTAAMWSVVALATQGIIAVIGLRLWRLVSHVRT